MQPRFAPFFWPFLSSKFLVIRYLNSAGLEPQPYDPKSQNVRPFQPTGRPQFKTFRPLFDRRDLNR
jgi:hypothetical protein